MRATGYQLFYFFRPKQPILNATWLKYRYSFFVSPSAELTNFSGIRVAPTFLITG